MEIENKVWDAFSKMSEKEMAFYVCECCNSLCALPLDGQHWNWLRWKYEQMSDSNAMNMMVESLESGRIATNDKWIVYDDCKKQMESVPENGLLHVLEKYWANIVCGILDKENEYFLKRLCI